MPWCLSFHSEETVSPAKWEAWHSLSGCWYCFEAMNHCPASKGKWSCVPIFVLYPYTLWEFQKCMLILQFCTEIMTRHPVSRGSDFYIFVMVPYTDIFLFHSQDISNSNEMIHFHLYDLKTDCPSRSKCMWFFLCLVTYLGILSFPYIDILRISLMIPAILFRHPAHDRCTGVDFVQRHKVNDFSLLPSFYSLIASGMFPKM